MKANGTGRATGQPSTRLMLDRVVETMRGDGFYAYVHLDEQNRWGVSADTEDGHADIRIEGGWFVVEVWDTSPGLFWEEENERRFHALERRARIVLPSVARGLVEPDQEIWWDENDHGVGARVQSAMAPEAIERIPSTVRRLFDELNQLLSEVERRLLD